MSEQLIDWLPKEFFLEFSNSPVMKHLKDKIVKVHKTTQEGHMWVGEHKWVFSWVELDSGYAVGKNENPSRGLSFPMVKLKNVKYCPTCKNPIKRMDKQHSNYSQDKLCQDCRELSLWKVIGEQARK